VKPRREAAGHRCPAGEHVERARTWARQHPLDRVALEISTNGRYKPVGELYPDPEFLAAARLPITLASDAHVPENVGRDFELALELARAAGYETVTVFEGRTARQEPLG